MKTEFNVERVCDRVHLCIVDAPEELGQPLIEVRDGSIHVSFPESAERLLRQARRLGDIALKPDPDGSLPATIGATGNREFLDAMASGTAQLRGILDAALVDSNSQGAPEACSLSKSKRPRK